MCLGLRHYPQLGCLTLLFTIGMVRATSEIPYQEIPYQDSTPELARRDTLSHPDRQRVPKPRPQTAWLPREDSTAQKRQSTQDRFILYSNRLVGHQGSGRRKSGEMWPTSLESASKSHSKAMRPRMGLPVACDANGCVCAPFSPVDTVELGNRYVREIDGRRRQPASV